MQSFSSTIDPEQIYHQLFEASNEALFLTDPDLTITDGNPTFQKLFGDPEDQRPIADILYKEGSIFRIQEALDENGQIDDEVFILLSQTDERLHTYLSLIPLKDRSDILLGYHGIIHDRSSRLQARHKRLRTQKMEMTNRMVRTLAHEIRNPLTNVFLALSSLEDSVVDEDSRFMLELLKSNSNRINDLLTDLLAASRVASLDKEPTNLQSLVDGALDQVRESLEVMGIDLSRFQPDTPLEVVADVDKVQLAFRNIIQNAIEALPEGGHLAIHIEEKKNKSVVSFKDNGPGIPEEDLEHVFDPFFTTKESGNGLGLNAVQNIIQSHEWYIDMESEEGDGSCFVIMIPR